MTSVLDQYQWIVVPQGLVSGSNGKLLKISLRVTPQLPRLPPQRSSGGRDPTLHDYAQAFAAERQALEAWPGYVWEGRVAARLSFRHKSATPQPDAPPLATVPLPVMTAWKSQVAALRFGLEGDQSSPSQSERLERATRLWQAVFPNTTPVVGRDPSTGPSVGQKRILSAWRHDRVSQEVNRNLGNVFTESLAYHANPAAPAPAIVMGTDTGPAAPATAAPLEPPTPGVHATQLGRRSPVLEALGVQQLPGNIANLAGIYTRQRFKVPRRRQESLRLTPLSRSLLQRLGVTDDESAERESESESRFLSDDARRFLVGRAAAIAQGGNEQVENTEADVDRRLYHDVLLKKLLTASDLPHKSRSTRDPQTGLDRDFHGVVGSLTLHPLLLQALGLTINLTIELPVPLGAEDFDFRIELVSSAATSHPQPEEIRTHPWVAVEGASGFPRSNHDNSPLRTMRMRAGCVELKNRFQLVQLDVDGVLEKLTNLATSYRSKSDAGTEPAELSVNPGTQRTAGLSLLQIDSAEYQQQRHEAASRLSSTHASERLLYGEDLTVGFRPDIRVMDLHRGEARCVGPWRSLVERRLASAHLDGLDISDWFATAGPDEGFIPYTLRVPKSDDGTPLPNDRFAQQELFQLDPDGWSLIVPHPSLSGQQAAELPGSAGFQSGAFNCRYVAVPTSWPIRIGRGVRMGLRAAFCDGQGTLTAVASARYAMEDSWTVGAQVDAARPGDPPVQIYLPFQRAETIAPPDVHLAEPLSAQRYPGDRGTRMVVTTALRDGQHKRSAMRYVVPPRRSLELAILHGMYDLPERRAQPPQSALAGAILRSDGTVPTVAQLQSDNLDREDQFVAPDQHETILHYGWLNQAPRVPYLPDPWAKRLVFAVYREADDQLLYIDYYDYYDGQHVWPNCRPLKVTLERAQSPELTSRGFEATLKDGSLTIRIAPAQQLRVRMWHEVDTQKLSACLMVDQISAYLSTHPQEAVSIGLADCPPPIDRQRLIECLGNWEKKHLTTLRNAMPPARRGAVVNLVSFWMINPTKSLLLVHAVDAPIRIPEIAVTIPPPESDGVAVAPSPASAVEEPFVIERALGATVATFHGDIEFDRGSTQRIVCSASWSDPIDDENDPAPKTVQKAAPLWTIEPIARVLTNPHVAPVNPPPVGSAPPGWPTADLPLPDIAIDNDLLLLSGVRERIGRVRPNADVGASSPIYDFHDTKARRLNVQLEAWGRFNTDFGADHATQSVKNAERYPVWVNSSKVPDPPVVDYVIPLLKWRRDVATQSSVREAGWFRLWLQRTWHSSGEGEQLAMVCWPQETFSPETRSRLFSWIGPQPILDSPPSEIEPFVTRWGSDPLWNDGVKLGCVPASAFRNRLDGDNPTLDSRPAVLLGVEHRKMIWKAKDAAYNVALALFRPTYAAERRQWYVDINIDPGPSYFPFIRLTLARYQPHSLPGVELSRIITTEIVQLMPRRAASLTATPRSDGSVKLAVTLTGAFLHADEEPQSADACVRPNRTVCYVRIEQRGEGWWGPTVGHAAQGTSGDTPAELRGPGDWVPVSTFAPLQRRGFGSRSREVQTTTLTFRPRGGHQYSVFLEEWEPSVDWTDGDSLKDPLGCVCGEGRLVYADRLLVSID